MWVNCISQVSVERYNVLRLSRVNHLHEQSVVGDRPRRAEEFLYWEADKPQFIE